MCWAPAKLETSKKIFQQRAYGLDLQFFIENEFFQW